MKDTTGSQFNPERHKWDDLILVVSPELQASMDEKLISAADIKEAIWLAEESGEKFYDEQDGMTMCSMVKPVITYWVQYRKTAPETYEIFRAYYHRMRFSEEGQPS